jgi:type II secretory pathway component GspD/PulD (secretin)
MQNSKSSVDHKIPLLGDIPLIGNLFKRKIRSGGKTELLIFLTPHVIPAPSQIASVSELERQRSLTPKSYSEEQLDRYLDLVPPTPAK